MLFCHLVAWESSFFHLNKKWRCFLKHGTFWFDPFLLLSVKMNIHLTLLVDWISKQQPVLSAAFFFSYWTIEELILSNAFLPKGLKWKK